MTKYLTIVVIVSFAFVAVMALSLFSSNQPINAKPEGQPANHWDKMVVIKGYDGARQAFIITQLEFTAIQPNLIDSSADINSPVNATLENVEDFLLKHSNRSP